MSTVATPDHDSSRALFIFAAVTAVAVMSLASFHYFKRNQHNPVTLHVCTSCSLTKRDATLTKPDGSKLESGKQMLTNLLGAFDNHPNWIKVSDGTFKHKLCKKDIQINPIQCFSACSNACSVIFSAPNKYQYHFARFNPDDVKDIEDVVTFGEQYVQSNDECHTKAADRPERLQKANTISRMPPVTYCRADCKGTQ